MPFSVNLPIVLIYFYFILKKNIYILWWYILYIPPGEPRKHRVGEVLQGRSKFKRSNVSTATLFFWNLLDNLIKVYFKS